MNREKFLQFVQSKAYSELEKQLKDEILGGSFDSQNLKYLGVSLEKQNNLVDALTYLKIAERVSVEDNELIEILAFTCEKANKKNSAINYFEKLIKQQPKNWLYAFRLGTLYAGVRSYSIAIQYLINARNLKPDCIPVYFELYKVFLTLEKFHECYSVLKAALEIQEQSPDLQMNAGLIAAQLHQYDSALKYLERSIELQPSPGAHLNLGNLYKQFGEIEKAIATTEKCIELAPNYLVGYQNLCIDHNYYWASKNKTFELAKKYGELASANVTPFTAWQVDPIPNKKLRVAFVSGDFRLHPVAHFLEKILDAIPRDQFDLVAYYNGEVSDSMTQRISKKFTEWNPAVNRLDNQSLAKKIYNDKIDILVDLSGHTAKTRTSMFAYKPAPIQVNWLGYFNTTGMTSIDWIIADRIVLPEKDKRYYTEKPFYMPDLYYAYSKPDLDIPLADPPVMKNGFITFGSFNNYPKLNNKVIKAWSKILLSVDHSKLFIKNRQLESVFIRNQLLERFMAHNIPADRIIMEGSSARSQYFTDFNKIDIALDSFPFPGGTTTIDCLWMGVPVLNLTGNTFISRQGETILKNAGLSDWITTKEADYIALAKKKSSNKNNLVKIRKNLRNKLEKSPVMNTDRFGKNLGKALQDMWKIYLEGTN